MSPLTPKGIEQILAAQRLGVLFTDQDQTIDYITGDDRILGLLAIGEFANPEPMAGNLDIVGRELSAVLPEFLGYEEQIAQIMKGREASLRLPWLNRMLAPTVTRYLDVVLLPRFDNSAEDAQICGLICVVEDSTATGNQHRELMQQRNDLQLLKRELEKESQALTIANTELAHANNTKSRFVSVAAHELRTPLAAISGFIDLLLEDMFGPLNSKQREFLNLAQGGARRLLEIVNNLLDVTMIESGHIELELTQTDLTELVNRVIVELTPIFQNRKQTVHTKVEPALPLALIDATRTIQILSNLLSNASKYSPEGRPITVTLSRADEAGFAQIAVADQGIGIPLDEQHRLFSAFYRASTVRLVNATGAGLGLHITAQLVELHGGRIWLDSQPERGSTFYVTLPLWETEEGDEG